VLVDAVDERSVEIEKESRTRTHLTRLRAEAGEAHPLPLLR
jgi:hypothetical protein